MEKQRPLWRSLLKPKPELPCTEKESAEPAASISGTMKRKQGERRREGGRGRFLHVLQQIVGGVDDGVGQVLTLGLNLASHTVSLPDETWGWISHAYSFRFGSPTPAITGLVLPLL